MMKKKLNCILLIDDNPANNYLSKRLINKAGISKKIVAMQTAKHAIEYLMSEENGKLPEIDLILLDINMPMMNGWEFLEAYSKLNQERRGIVVIVMLTTSPNPDDEERAKNTPLIQGFKKKPLTLEALQDIVETYFADRL